MRFRVPLLSAALLLSGCYVMKQAQGQLRILSGARPIQDLLADPSVPGATKEKLRLILEVKEFGEREMGLAPSDNYTRVYDTGGEPVSHLVSACRKDRFAPHTWWFPVVGTVPYKGFFDPADAESEAADLEGRGYDVARQEVAAYSTLGWFSDPLFSPTLEAPEEEIAALVLHELTHSTLYVNGDADFNESLASFVGRQGALEFVRWRFGRGSPVYDRTVQRTAAAELRDAAALDLFRRLDDLYRSGTSTEDILAIRDQVAGEPVNNAEILMQRRYGSYEEMRTLFERAGGDWRLFFGVLRKRAELQNEAP
jgi:predicted aminopeptidase